MIFDYPDKVNLPSYRPTYRGNAKQIRAGGAAHRSAPSAPCSTSAAAWSAPVPPMSWSSLANALQLPVVTTLMGKGAFPASNPLNIGPVGMHGSKYANLAMTESDLIIACRCALLRPRDGQALRVRPACRRHPHRHRPCRDRQDSQGADPHRRRSSAACSPASTSAVAKAGAKPITARLARPDRRVARVVSRSTTPTWWNDPGRIVPETVMQKLSAQARP